ncbi:MAG: hypothetical protein JNK68_03850 [Betaproteobacteria bacterium]|nr:hypothetical protein [Betaproteobacteria bacterium]
MDESRDSYKRLILRILGNFQLLEFALKAYIGRAYSVIKSRVGDAIHFDYSEKDVESFPLERLLNTFSKLNTNKELVARLNKLREKRNHIAHTSLIVTMGTKYDPDAVEDKCDEYLLLEDELAQCLQLVIEEAQRIFLIVP